MDEKISDNEEKRENKRVTIHQKDSYVRRPLSTLTSDNNQTYRPNRRSVTVSLIDTTRRSQMVNHRSEHTLWPMESSILPKYTSSPSFAVDQRQQKTSDDEEKSTYSFRHVSKKLQHAKSHGELYQPYTPLPLPPMTKTNSDENEKKYRMNYSSDSPESSVSTRTRAATTTSVPILTQSKMNSSDDTSTLSSSSKLPLWKRFKKVITPKKKKREEHTASSKMPSSQPDVFERNGTGRKVSDSATMSNHHHHHHHHQLKHPIKVNELRTWLTSKPFPEQRIREEYESLPIEPLHPQTLAFRPENKSKNRFNAIEPYDHSRVVLRTMSSDPFSDYINASYIDGYRTSKLYIAAQAPTDSTLYDFVRMVWQLRIQSIVTVTRLYEDGKHKCLQYWPDDGEKRVNEFIIRIDNEEKYADYSIRTFVLYNQSEPSEVLSVKQYHFLSWPDHGLSLSTTLLDFRQRFRSEYKPSGPILVHCSAGVGRSGTFIALDALLDEAEHQDTIDVLDFTYRMRQNRVHMIQTPDQYVFLYRTLIEGILTMDTSVSLEEYLTTKKLRMDPKNQYKLLVQLQAPAELSYRGALEPANMGKNRVETILASDNNRPYLMTQVDRATDYINAVIVNSYRHTPSYIVTQFPLPHTCVDFWRLVYDHKVSIIMLLESIPRDLRINYYWSTTIGQVTQYGPFEVVLASQKEDDQLVERVFEIQCRNKNSFTNDRTRVIRQFQVKDSSHFPQIVKRFLKEMRTYSEQNVILQCLNGATWSGYFAALCNSIDKMQTEKIIDPFKIVRLLRAVRPEFVDQDQYETLLLSMRDYVQQYLTNTSAHRTSGSTSYTNTNEQDRSVPTTRVSQRL